LKSPMVWRVYSQLTQTWRFTENHSKHNEIVTQNYYLLTVFCFTVHLGRVVRTSCVPEKVGVNKNNILINKKLQMNPNKAAKEC